MTKPDPDAGLHLGRARFHATHIKKDLENLVLHCEMVQRDLQRARLESSIEISAMKAEAKRWLKEGFLDA
jgi:hypothetical protein